MRIPSAILLSALTAGCVPTTLNSYTAKGPMAFADYPYTSVDATPWPEKAVVLDEVQTRYDLGVPARIHYVELNPEGAQTIVLLHGLGSYLKFWRYQIDWLAAQGYRVIALDMLGYGKSAKPAQFPYTMVAMADVVHAFVTKLGIEQPILFGHSMGGQTALTYAIRHPDKLTALVLAAPAGFEKFSSREKAWFKSVFNTTLIKSVGESGLWGTVRRSNFYRWQPEYAWLIEERARVRLTEEFDAYAYANVKSVHGLLETGFTRSHLDKVTAPTLIVYGDKDRLIPNRFMHGGPTSEIMAYGERIPDVQIVELVDCGHTVQIDCSGEFNATVGLFLDRAGTATSAPESAILEPPFSATTIRDGTPAGTEYIFKSFEPNGEVILIRMAFPRVDSNGCTLVSQALTLDGNPDGEANTAERTWAELESHAHYPRTTTKVTTTEVTVPAGRFVVRLYTSKETKNGSELVTRAYFAMDKPGPPSSTRSNATANRSLEWSW